ncbi:MAG TPA: GNAT family N-acetyltransferase [Pyrinomonadaceae bacterium]|nr:GNAT family N-acetyltransferase [Pyrinomonadaceae bacterium]
MNLQIKTAAEKDVPEVIDLLRQFAEFENLSHEFTSTEKSLLETVFGENAFVYLLVGRRENDLIAFALLYPKYASFRGERSLYLEDLYVDAEARGNGYGTAMLKYAAKFAKSNGFQRLDWQALKWNAPAIDFYTKIGAEPDDGNINFRLVGKNFENLAR